jgi:hypothetical protein
MATQPPLYFDEYTVRRAGEEDREYLTQIIDADPYHKGLMDADFFLQLVPGEDAWAVEDEQGRVVLYFKTATAVRLSMLFANQDSNVIRDVLKKGMNWLQGVLIGNKFREIIFDTAGAALRAMAKRRLGFVDPAPGTLVKPLLILGTGSALAGHWHHRPTASGSEGG